MNALKVIQEKRLVPVAVIENVEDAVPLAEALLEGGLNIIEITLRTEAAMDAISVIRNDYPEMMVGAGTVLNAADLTVAAREGVSFAVSPGLNEEVVEAAAREGLPLTPGVVTPTEVERAMGMGLKVLKFFPAEASGGAKFLKALAGPYARTGVRFVPTGGINAGNAADYLSLSTVAAIGGSWFVATSLVKEGKFQEITDLTREALSLASA